MDLNGVYEVVKFFEGSTLSELNLEMEGVRIGMKKGGLVEPVLERTVSAAPVQKDEPKQESKPVASDDVTMVEAPLVGTFYKAPAQNEAPFVLVGQQVKKGDVIGIIEAMKLMNEITAPCDGIVEAIYVEDGEMVDFHKALMAIK